MIVYILSKFITIFFGMLYPVYTSFKTIKNKDAKEYVQWMMYWVVFVTYLAAEVFLDAFFSFWFPFYYEVKILFMFWLLSPTTRGGATLYKTFIHPILNKHEKEIDGYLADAKRRTGNMFTRWGSKALSYITDTFVRVVLRAPHLSFEYLLENPQQREGRMIGQQQDYDRNLNQGDGFDYPYDRPDNGRRHRFVNDKDKNMDDQTPYFNESDSEASNTRADNDPSFVPPAAIRREAKLSKKLKNEQNNINITPQSLRKAKAKK